MNVEDAWACPCEPLCGYCRICPHCPEHPEECIHPCFLCGADIAFDQPVCFNEDCPSNDESGDPYNITEDAIKAMNEVMADPDVPTRKLPPREL